MSEKGNFLKIDRIYGLKKQNKDIDRSNQQIDDKLNKLELAVRKRILHRILWSHDDNRPKKMNKEIFDKIWWCHGLIRFVKQIEEYLEIMGIKNYDCLVSTCKGQL